MNTEFKAQVSPANQQKVTINYSTKYNNKFALITIEKSLTRKIRLKKVKERTEQAKNSKNCTKTAAIEENRIN